MGGAQSAQRGSDKDPAAAEETDDKLVKNNRQTSEINRKADGTIAEVNGHCEDEISAVAKCFIILFLFWFILLPDKDVSKAEKPLKEETPLEKVEINENESSNKADANEEITLDMIEMDAKQNDINESFKRFFSNINFKLTVKRGSAEKADITVDVPEHTTEEEPNKPVDAAQETKSEHAERGACETSHQDSTCPTLTDVGSEAVQEIAEEKVTETKEVDSTDKAGLMTTLPVAEDEKVQQNAEPEEDLVVSPIKRFFTTGIFGLRRRRKPAEDETTEKELADIRTTEAVETTQKNVEVQQDIEISVGVEATAETGRKETELKEENLSGASAQTTDEGKSPSTEPSTIIVNEPEILSSQEKDKVQASPLKRLLSGSSLKKSSKRQQEKKSSDARLSDSGEHVSNQLLSSTNGADDQKEECPAGEEDGAWASFKKLVTPKRSVKKSSSTNEEKQIPSAVTESKLSEGEQISDHSTEEGKKRKDSSVSWEAVLCGSGRRRSRSRKTSDSDDEKPQVEDDNKQESPLESSNEADGSLVSSGKQAGSPPDADGGSTWKSFKKLVTPKRKAKDEDTQSDVGAPLDDSSFSIKKLLPGQKKRKPAEKQDYVSSDEADKEEASDDEDSATPAVIPLSEFDIVETGVHLQTQADIESHLPKEAAYEIQEDVPHKTTEPLPPGDSLQTEAKMVQESKDASEKERFTTPASNVQPEEVTELISKHQQLSDIPEEGVITETAITPSSVTEEPARDDTIAEDMIEITSEAITAPEPVDNTLADETEMVSAVSQLSDSSKTSGNATPVPAEYDIRDTEELLQQVVENICTSPKARHVCSEDLQSERIVSSVSHQILQSFKKQDPKILELHRRSDATAICTGLKVKELDAINEVAATAQTESLSEVSEAVSTEFVSEVPTEEFDTAELSMDEIHRINVTHLEESIKKIESTNENQDVLECESDVTEAMHKEILPKSEETVADECSLVEVPQAKLDSFQTDIQEEESRDGVQSVYETKDAIMQNITDQIQAENQDQPSLEVQELQALATAEAAILNAKEDPAQLPEKEVTTEDVLPAAMVTDQSKEEPEHLTEVNAEPERVGELQTDAQVPALDSKMKSVVHELKHETEPVTETNAEPEKEDKLQTDADKAEYDSEMGGIETPTMHMPLSDNIVLAETVSYEPKEDEKQRDAATIKNDQVSEELGKVVESKVDSATTSTETPEKEEIPSLERVLDEPEEETQPVTEVRDEQEKDDKLQTDAATSQHMQVSAIQASALDSEISRIKTTEKEILLSEDTALEEAITHKLKDGTEPVTEDSAELEKKDKLQTDTTPTTHVQVSEVLGGDQATAADSEMGGTETSVMDTVRAETVTYEPKEEPDPVNAEQEKEDELQVDAAKTEYGQVSKVLWHVHDAAVDAEMTSTETPEKDLTLLEDIPSSERVMDERREEIEPVTEVTVEYEKDGELQTDATETERVQVSEVLRVHATALDLQIGCTETPENKTSLSEDTVQEERLTDEPKEEIQSVTEVTVEPQKDNELQTQVGISEDKQVQQISAVQAAGFEPEMGSIQTAEMEVALSDVVPPAEAATEEPEEKTKPLTEVNVTCEKEDEQAHPANTEYRQVPEVLAVQEAALDSDIVNSNISEKKMLFSEDTAPRGSVTHEVRDETEPDTEIDAEPQKEDKLRNYADKTEYEQVSEVLGHVHTAAVDAKMTSGETPKKDVQSLEDVTPPERVTTEPKEEPESLTEVTVEPENEDELQTDAAKTEHVDVSEVLAVQVTAADLEMGSTEPPEKEMSLSETDIPLLERLTDAPEEEILVTKITVEPEKEDELQATGAITEYRQELDVLAVQAAALDSQISEKEILLPEDTALGEGLTQIKDESELVTEDNVECEKENELQTDAEKIVQVQVSGVLGGDQASTVDSEMGGPETSKIQLSLSEDIVQAVTFEPREESEPVTEVNVEPEKEDELHTDAGKTEYVQISEELGCEPEVPVDSQMTSMEPPEREVPLLEDTPSSDRVMDEPKEKIEPVGEVTVEYERDDEQKADAAKPECRQAPEALAVEAAALDSEIRGSKTSENEILISEDPALKEAVTHELTDKTQPVTEVNAEPEKEEELQTIRTQTALAQVSAVLRVQASTVDSEMGGTETSEMQMELSDDTGQAKTLTYEPKEETVTDVNVEPEKEDELQSDAAKTVHVHAADVLVHVQATAIDSEVGGTETTEMQVIISEDIPQGETATSEVRDEIKPVTEDELEKKGEPQTDSAKSEYGQVPDVLAVQAAALDLQPADKNEESLSEDIRLEETTNPLTEVHSEPEDKEPLVDKPIKDQHHIPIVSEAVQVPTLDLDEGGVLLQTAQKETGPPTESNVQSVNAFKTEPAQAEHSYSEEDSVVSLEMEVISGDTPPTESVTDEPSHATEVSTEPKEEIRVEDAQESDVLSFNAKHTVTETESENEKSTPGHGTASNVHNEDADYVIASVTDANDSKAGTEFNQAMETNEDQSFPQDVRVEQEAGIPEVAAKLQTLIAVHVSSVNEKTNRVTVLEKKAISEELPAPCGDKATVTYEPEHEVQLSEVQGSVEGEKEGELPGVEVNISAVEHAVVTQVITCNIREVSAGVPDVLIEQTLDIHEPLVATIANELEFKEEVEIATPMAKSDTAETAKEERAAVMMQVPSSEFEDHHRIQVQVVEVDVKSAEMVVDSLLNVGATEAKEVIDVCHESVRVPDKLVATEGTEEELINEEKTLIIHKVIQNVKENLTERVIVETIIQDEVINLEQQTIKQPHDVTLMRQMAESESDVVDNRKEEEEITTTVGQRQDEALISDVPGSLDSIHDHAEEHTSGVTTEEVKPLSEEVEMKTINEEAQISPTTTSKTALEIPQSLEKRQAEAPEAKEDLKQMSQSLVLRLKIPSSQHQERLRAVTTSQAVLLDISIPAMTTQKLEEEIKSTQGVTANVQEKGKMQTETASKNLSEQKHLYEVENPTEQTEEENDQDLWMDAEEEIYTQEQSTESDQEEKAEVPYAFETAPETDSKSTTKEEDSQLEMQKTGESGETENESEEFAVAPEHLGTTSVAPRESD
ncbi:hypothetical protein Q5P01_020774 [Channa striata]|uniref:A kinase-anchoring proteins AKAP-5 and AKAP-12 calmodulin (CaM)-binding domain-containing protein n=1 Tax=Channa striata TaxID=64152 RepID=A0AA88M0K0_CHASR|nr:hypothetical protein Q5P01_020774 [Channa striata]